MDEQRTALRLKPDEPELNRDEPWADDKLERKPIAEALTNIITGETNPLVISLNGGWGTGKTFLLKRSQAQLELDGFKALYFNAWEDDYLGDPLVAILGQLWNEFKAGKFKRLVESVREAAKPLLLGTALNAVRTGTIGIVDLNQGDLQSTADSLIQNYEAEHKSRRLLSQHLSTLANKIFDETKGKPLVVIIDELDRCRPTFAIEMLERVKHIFSVPKMLFVLGLDRNQLGSSIQSVYGGIDVDGYLRRFIDMEFQLPQADPRRFCKYVLERYGLHQFFTEKGETRWREYEDFRLYFSILCDGMAFSLRDIEHCTRSFVIAAKNFQDGHEIFPELLSILILLRLRNNQLYINYVSGRAMAKDVLEYLENCFIKAPSARRNREALSNLHAMLYLSDSSEDDRSAFAELRKELEQLAGGEKLTSAKYIADITQVMPQNDLEHVLGLFDHYIGRGRCGRGIVKYISEKIELAALLMKESH